jgi:hypothetical protein
MDPIGMGSLQDRQTKGAAFVAHLVVLRYLSNHTAERRARVTIGACC